MTVYDRYYNILRAMPEEEFEAWRADREALYRLQNELPLFEERLRILRYHVRKSLAHGGPDGDPRRCHWSDLKEYGVTVEKMRNYLLRGNLNIEKPLPPGIAAPPAEDPVDDEIETSYDVTSYDQTSYERSPAELEHFAKQVDLMQPDNPEEKEAPHA